MKQWKKYKFSHFTAEKSTLRVLFRFAIGSFQFRIANKTHECSPAWIGQINPISHSTYINTRLSLKNAHAVDANESLKKCSCTTTCSTTFTRIHPHCPTPICFHQYASAHTATPDSNMLPQLFGGHWRYQQTK